jgi:hypothetical protein
MEVKLLIQKKFEIDSVKSRKYNNNWHRFRRVEQIIIDEFSPICTETDLAWYIYTRHGTGRFMITETHCGQRGFRIFWIGEILHQGFLRDKVENKELSNLKFDLKNTTSELERDDIEENMNFERKVSKYRNRRTPILIKTLKPGELHSFDNFSEYRPRIKSD